MYQCNQTLIIMKPTKVILFLALALSIASCQKTEFETEQFVEEQFTPIDTNITISSIDRLDLGANIHRVVDSNQVDGYRLTFTAIHLWTDGQRHDTTGAEMWVFVNDDSLGIPRYTQIEQFQNDTLIYHYFPENGDLVTIGIPLWGNLTNSGFDYAKIVCTDNRGNVLGEVKQTSLNLTTPIVFQVNY